MAVSNIGGTGAGAASSPTQSLQVQNSLDPEQEFLKYMNESPAQRMEDAWLSAHGISEQAFNAMSPAQKKALMDEMKQDIELQMKQQAQNAATSAKGNTVRLPIGLMP